MQRRRLLGDTCWSSVRLLSVSLKKEKKTFGAGRWNKVSTNVRPRRKIKRLRLGYLDRLGVAGATRGPEGPPWEPKTPRQD